MSNKALPLLSPASASFCSRCDGINAEAYVCALPTHLPQANMLMKLTLTAVVKSMAILSGNSEPTGPAAMSDELEKKSLQVRAASLVLSRHVRWSTCSLARIRSTERAQGSAGLGVDPAGEPAMRVLPMLTDAAQAVEPRATAAGGSAGTGGGTAAA